MQNIFVTFEMIWKLFGTKTGEMQDLCPCETKKLFGRSNLSFSPPYLAFNKEIFSELQYE